MRIQDAYADFLAPPDGAALLRHIERCGRVCYKSEHRITEHSAQPFVAALVRRGHESVLEHASVTVRFVCDRGVSHEIVRHRIASYSQESTRYCNYANENFGREITVIRPFYLREGDEDWNAWRNACLRAEAEYLALLDHGRTPQEARAVLPTSLKTELIMTANLREWRHFFRLRTDRAAHPQMREVAQPLLEKFQQAIPVAFDDLVAPADGCDPA